MAKESKTGEVHENVIKLKEIVASPGTHPSPYVQSGYLIHKHQTYTICNRYKGSIYMIFGYMDHSLTGLADCPELRFTIQHINCYMK
ncbi:unnamed protein product [Coffea canephora]|uniref:DH200=94 genomic scaffold, scaffold_1960 n=1 Tax=Coffea canephora TaxID=49390 RepID=A0A068VJV8_COFCA|nr:unnamed protein product [Coffea canephora]